jgi:hypothetical protein
MGKKHIEWNKVHFKGSPPCPRFLTTMNFYEEGNYLIIHGGRNDLNSDSFALNDTYIFEVSRLQWVRVEIMSSNGKVLKVFNRCGHCSIIYCNLFLYS